MISRLLKVSKVTAAEKTDNVLRIGCLGAANIAPYALIYPCGKIPNAVVHGVAARKVKKAQKFAKKHNIPKVFDSYEQLIESDEIDAIYNPLPNGYHAYYTILALKKGKHVLCEKPMASNQEEVRRMMEAQEAAPINPRTQTKALLVEAVHCRFHPLLRRVKKMVKENVFGEIKEVKCAFIIPSIGFGKSDIRYNVNGKHSELAGGSLMDAGSYAVSVLRLVVEASLAGDTLTDEEAIEATTFSVTESEIQESFKGIKGIDKAAKATLEFRLKHQETDKEAGKEDKVVKGEVISSFNGWGFGATCRIIGTKKIGYIYNFVAPFVYHYMTLKDVETKRSQTFKEYSSSMEDEKEEAKAMKEKKIISTYDYQMHNFVNAVFGDEKCLEICKFAGGLHNSLRTLEVLDEIYVKAGAQPRKGKDLEALE